MEIKIRQNDVLQVLKSLQSGDYLRYAAVKGGQAAVGELQRITPKDTGAASKGWRAVVQGNEEDAYSITVFNDNISDLRADILETGSRPHVIKPRLKKALSFDLGGVRRAYMKVNHPGTPAFNVYTRTENFVAGKLEDYIDEFFDKTIEIP